MFKFKDTNTNAKEIASNIGDLRLKMINKSDVVWLQGGLNKMSIEISVKEKFRILLQRLLILVEKDGRIPMSVKVMVRKHEEYSGIAHKETKQSPLPGYLFSKPFQKLNENEINKLLDIIMNLFNKIVNKSRSFQIILLGLTFSKFKKTDDSCFDVTSFLLDKEGLGIQTLSSFMSSENFLEPTEANVFCYYKSESDSEEEPSPKKTKLDLLYRST